MELQRKSLIADRSLKGSDFTAAYTAHIDEWLRWLATDVGVPDGAAVVAVGGYGRREMAPNSDVDLLLVHKPGVDMADFAKEFCYPIWDSGLKLGHQVSTIKKLIKLARSDLDTATALLDVRHLCGDESLSNTLAQSAAEQWRADAVPNVLELHDRLTVEHDDNGEVAFTLGPDLKDGRGGLRDVQAFRWAIASGLLRERVTIDDLAGPTEVLLRARVELHRVASTRTDRLMLEYQDDVANALGYADGDELMIDVARAARSIVWVTSAQWFFIERSLHGRRRKTDHQHFGDIEIDGALLSIAADSDIASDPTSILRVASAAAKHRAFIERDTLLRLVDETEKPISWNAELRELFVSLLLHGHAAIPVVEALDQVGIMTMLIPEWEPCRSKPQRNSYHRFTVDRHLLESAAEAASLQDRVARPDLLVVGSLLHDIGKGYTGDHTEVGVDLIETIGRRMGFDEDDTGVLVDMCRYHLLLPDVATRRDLDDDGTIKFVAELVGSEELLHLLAALTEADSVATGPAAWNGARAELVYTLVDRVQYVLDGGEAAEVVPARSPAPEQRAMMRAGKFLARIVDDNITVVQPNRPGAFSRVAGVLTLNGLDILSATAHTDHGTALCEFRVRKGSEIDTLRLEAQLEAGVSGRLALEARVDERRGTYSRTKKRLSAQKIIPSVSFDNITSDQATVIEVTGPDEIGLLYRISRSFIEVGIMVTAARIQTIGDVVVDTFYTTYGGQKIVDEAHLAEIERAIIHAIARS